MSDVVSPTDSTNPADPFSEGGQPGVLLHIPPVMDPVTGEPIPLVIDATVTVTPPNGAARTFARYMENLLTSSQGYNLYLPDAGGDQIDPEAASPLSSMVP